MNELSWQFLYFVLDRISLDDKRLAFLKENPTRFTLMSSDNSFLPADPAASHPNESRFVWVQCEGFRCLGYKDQNGVWRNSFSGDVLEKVIAVYQL